jgi:hypothetical protein
VLDSSDVLSGLVHNLRLKVEIELTENKSWNEIDRIWVESELTEMNWNGIDRIESWDKIDRIMTEWPKYSIYQSIKHNRYNHWKINELPLIKPNVNYLS